ncbi:hypothetical protein [Caulobacter sp.]|uniref:hypothetical protein n=1 Tax=Caulobacter sp. TaxID=78 RepID=UPI001B0BF024|nr:hypothetical protein [Caulobacter sp.]MBO9544660.1 hypothetical protein [Caulobacter sp.]
MSFAAIYAVLFPILVTIAVNRNHWGDFLVWFTGDGGAGWVQAIGSIVSILASGWFVARQIKANRDLEVEKSIISDSRKIRQAFISVKYQSSKIIAMVSSMEKRLDDGSMNGRRSKMVVDGLGAGAKFLSGIDTGMLPSSVMVGMFDLELGCDVVSGNLQDFISGTCPRELMDKSIDRLRVAVENLRTSIDESMPNLEIS